MPVCLACVCAEGVGAQQDLPRERRGALSLRSLSPAGSRPRAGLNLCYYGLGGLLAVEVCCGGWGTPLNLRLGTLARTSWWRWRFLGWVGDSAA